MTMCTECKKKGMNLEQYRTFKANIEACADAVVILIKQKFKIDNGIYYPLDELFTNMDAENYNWEIHFYLIDALKERGVEFLEEDGKMFFRY